MKGFPSDLHGIQLIEEYVGADFLVESGVSLEPRKYSLKEINIQENYFYIGGQCRSIFPEKHLSKAKRKNKDITEKKYIWQYD